MPPQPHHSRPKPYQFHPPSTPMTTPHLSTTPTHVFPLTTPHPLAAPRLLVILHHIGHSPLARCLAHPPHLTHLSHRLHLPPARPQAWPLLALHRLVVNQPRHTGIPNHTRHRVPPGATTTMSH